MVGTLPYLAPEQLKEESITARTDIYALGATLYEMVSGQRTFPQPDVPSLVTAKAKGDYIPLKSSSFMPKDLIDIIDRCLATVPGKRFGSALELGKSLENVLQDILEDKEAFVLDNLVKRIFSSKG